MNGQSFGKDSAAWGVYGQVLQSLANFLTGIILISYASKDEFGNYAIVMATMLVVIGISNALITTQMTVRAPKKERQREYVASMLMLQTVLFGPLILLIAAAGYWYHSMTTSNLSLLLLFMPLYLLPILWLEFARRALFIYTDLRAAFMMDCFYTTAYLLLLYGAVKQDYADLNLLALLISGGCAAVSAILFFVWTELPLGRAWGTIRSSFHEAWGQGRWALGGVALTWLQNQGYVYILAFFSGASAVAEINAVRLLLAPIAVFSMAIGKVLLPRLASLWHQEKQQAIDRLMSQALLAYIIVIAFYAAVFYVISETILGWFPDSYQFSFLVFVSWAFFFLFQGVRNIASLMIQVSFNFRPLTIRSALVASFSLIFLLIIVPYFGPQNAVSVMALGECFLGFLLWQYYLRRIRLC